MDARRRTGALQAVAGDAIDTPTDRAPAPSPPPAVLAGLPLPAVFAGGPRAERRFWEFFATQLANDNTRRAYFNAARRFAEWCELHALAGLRQVQPIHVSAYLKALHDKLSTPTVKQHLAALRMLFDWLVIGHVLDVNPAHAVRGPKHSTKKGKTPVLAADEARTLLDSIALTRTVTRDDGTETEQPLLIGLRDRALIGLMVYTFARVGAALGMRVEDYYIQARRGWVRLHEKGGKLHTLPCHHNLDRYLDEYIAAAGIAGDPKGWLFRTARDRSGLALTGNALWQKDAHRMIQRRAKAAGIKTQIGNHTFRATGITAYLKNGGLLETAQQMAGHESPRTTGLYDRRSDDVSLDEVEKITI
jgi:integrase/recombinase XerD